MNDENTLRIVRAFPNLYSKHDPLFSEETEMYFNFDVGDGWFQLLFELSEKLEAEIVRLIKEGIPPEDLPSVQQVKEKYGELCFYVSGTDKMQNDIAAAEEKSLTICELCGATGALNVDLATEPIHTWLMVRCSEHWGITPAQWNKMQ